jgi:hypothetical protein
MKKDSQAYIDNDPKLDLEKNSLFRKFSNLFFIPILNLLPGSSKNLIKKSNHAASVVIENATNHEALEVLYSKGELFSFKGFLNNISKYIWFNLNNSKAVRNRLKFVKREISQHLDEISQFDKEIKILSIASGSSRAIIEVVKEKEYLKDAKLSITFLDKNEKAIDYSKKMSTNISHLPITLDWIHDSAGNFLRSDQQGRYDIIEIVGLLDYFTDEKIIEAFTGIYAFLQEGGIMITSNINHNSEEKFITKVIEWPMIYRKAEELGVLANKAGFDYNKMKVFYEPLKIHGLVIAKK